MNVTRRRFHEIVLGSVGFGAMTGSASAQLVTKYAEDLRNGEFNWFPERSPRGPLLIIVSIPDQKVHVYRNGIRIAASTCSTGKPGHSTPTGVFKILQKDKHHRSSTYSNAPMPNMNRLTWSGIALHAGNLPGYPASHGCVRLPMEFSERLFGITRTGMTVVIADNRSYPSEVAHPGLVLGDYARHEFGGVDASVRRSQYSEGRAAPQRSTSLVVSGKDQSLSVFEDDQLVAQGKVTIRDAHRPIGENVHTLTGTDANRQQVRWSSASHGRQDKADLAVDLSRIQAEPKMREEVRKRMHHGATVVTTNGPSTPSHRSARDFVVIDGIY